MTGDHHYRTFNSGSFHFLEGFYAVHPGHLDVAKDEVVLTRNRLVNTRFTAIGFVYFEIFVFQNLFQ